MKEETPKIRCHDGCGEEAEYVPDKPPPGWSYLESLRAYRCPKCWRELQAASTIVGTPPVPGVDPLPPNSIGALKKETASSILPPSVRPLE